MRKIVTSVAFGLLSSGVWLAACSSDDAQNDGGTGTDSGPKPDGTVADTGKTDATTDTGIDTGTDGGIALDTGADGGDAGPSFDFWVLRVGAGGVDAAALSNASTPIFIEQRSSSTGAIGTTIALPIGANDGGGPITISGTATSEGDLELSGDTHYVTVAGYSSAPGTASVASSASNTVNRAVARIDKNGVVDTTTKFDSFSGNNVRTAVTNDGTSFWIGGANVGVINVPINTSTVTIVESTSTNNRAVAIAAGQLYGGTGSGNTYRVFTIGTGLPTTTGQTITNLPGIVNTDGGVKSSYSFQLMDLDQQVSGVDTLYIADDSATNAGGGIQKWTYDGNVWTFKRTFNDQLTTGCFHVVTAKIGSDVHVVCSSAENPSRLVRYVDDGQIMSPMGTVLATAQPGTQFRGVARVPQ